MNQKFVQMLSESFKEKDWVEITNGVYKGKKGYISNVNGSAKRVTIELTVKGDFVQDSEPFDNIKKVTKPKLNESKNGTFSINMKQFKEKWQHYSDNVHYAEKIEATKGKFHTMDAEPYIKWLNEFNIFYTLKQ